MAEPPWSWACTKRSSTNLSPAVTAPPLGGLGHNSGVVQPKLVSLGSNDMNAWSSGLEGAIFLLTWVWMACLVLGALGAGISVSLPASAALVVMTEIPAANNNRSNTGSQSRYRLLV